MPEIVCLMFVYQSGDTVLEALKSIDGKVDKILCFDGRWEGYTGPDHSTDETQQIVLEFSKSAKSQVHYIMLSVLHQWQARTVALKYLHDGDWAICIDSDEIITAWEDDVRNTLLHSIEKIYRVCWAIANKTYSAMTVANRCVKKTETVHMSTDHRRLFDKDGELDILHAPIIHIAVDHQKMSEKKKMRKQADAYKDWLLKYETTHWNPEDGFDPNQIVL